MKMQKKALALILLIFVTVNVIGFFSIWKLPSPKEASPPPPPPPPPKPVDDPKHSSTAPPTRTPTKPQMPYLPSQTPFPIRIPQIPPAHVFAYPDDVVLKNAKRVYELPDYKFSVQPNPICDVIDAVYLWVNGSDPMVASQYKDVFGKDLVVDKHLRDIPLLKYSVRALLTYAPFIRNVIIVTNGQVPDWVNMSNPRVRLVSHEEIFEHPEYLPTFNSNAIESQLSRIPGIAPCWFSLDDDFAFGRAVNLNHWMDLNTGQQKLNFINVMAPKAKSIKANSEHDMSVGYSNYLVNKYYYPEDFDDKTTIANVKHKNYYNGHGVRFIQQHIMEGLYERFHDEFVETSSHRVRFENDTVMAFLYNQYAMREYGATRSVYLQQNSAFQLFSGKPKQTDDVVKQMLKERPISWCLNDDAPASNAGKDKMEALEDSVRSLIQIMENEFPLPSEIEKLEPDQVVIPRTLEEWYAVYRIYPNRELCRDDSTEDN